MESNETHRPGVTVGDNFQETVALDAQSIKKFASAAGDYNPLHHDIEFAKRSRFGTLIASGTHTAALILGAIASYVSERSPSLGLGYSVRLKRAVLAGETMTIAARVVSITPKPSLKGDIVVIEAEMRNETGEVAVAVKAESLLTTGK